MSLREQSGAAGRESFLQRSSSQAELLDAMIARLPISTAPSFVFNGVIIWAEGSAHLPCWLLLRVLAYRLQAVGLGVLDKATVRSIRPSKSDAQSPCEDA